MSDNSKILIVGAGAGGLVTGYYFSQGGADVTFYVRPSRIEELQTPRKLYSYDDCQTKIYDNYSLLSDVSEVAKNNYDFVLITLDGNSLESAEGIVLLAALGEAIKDTQAIVVSFAVGPNIREFFVEKMTLPSSRLVCGTFNLLSHFVPMATQVQVAPVDYDALNQAHIAYRHLNNKGGLMVDKVNLKASQKLADIYGRNGYSKVSLLSPLMVNMAFNALFPFFIACELAGWPPTEQMVKDKTLWPMASRAANEILKLPIFGWGTNALGVIMLPALWRQAWMGMHKGSLPLDWNDFNRLHHGGKVMQQDIDIMYKHYQTGQQRGMAMPNMKALLDQVEGYRAKATKP